MTKVNIVTARFFILTLLMLIVWMSSKPTIHQLVKRHLEETTGGQVDIGEMFTDFRRGTMELNDFALANPRSPSRNLFQAREANLQLDLAELASRRIVVNNGRAGGVQMDTPRTTFSKNRRPDSTDANDQFGLANFSWRQTPQDAQHQFLDHMVTWSVKPPSTATPNLSVEHASLKRQWTTRIRELVQKADGFRQTLQNKVVATQTSTGPKNALRADKSESQQQIVELMTLRQNLTEITAELDKLKSTGNSQINDLALRLTIPPQGPAPLFVTETQEAAVAKFMLSELAAQESRKVLEWLDWFYSVYPDAERNFLSATGPGRDVEFVGMQTRPMFLIRELDIEGSGTVNGSFYELAGKIVNYSPQSQFIESPTTMAFRAQGKQHFSLNASLDRRSPESVDQFSISCPDFNIASTLIGNEESLVANLSSATCRAQADLQVVDERLTGTLRIGLSGTALFAEHVSNHVGGEEIRNLLNQEINAIQNFEMLVQLDGTRSQIQLKLESDLGQKIYAALAAAKGQQRKFNHVTVDNHTENSALLEDLRQFLTTEIESARRLVEEQTLVAEQLETSISGGADSSSRRLR